MKSVLTRHITVLRETKSFTHCVLVSWVTALPKVSKERLSQRRMKQGKMFFNNEQRIIMPACTFLWTDKKNCYPSREKKWSKVMNKLVTEAVDELTNKCTIKSQPWNKSKNCKWHFFSPSK